MKTYNVTINGQPNTLKLTYQSGAGFQYNTSRNESGYTFKRPLSTYPKQTPIKTSGITLVIID